MTPPAQSPSDSDTPPPHGLEAMKAAFKSEIGHLEAEVEDVVHAAVLHTETIVETVETTVTRTTVVETTVTETAIDAPPQPFVEKRIKKQKVAVLGGGVGAMTTVFELTNLPDWQERYDITVYQLGWRLGGKGASGRGPNARIEEHGLHIWLGFYDNAFRMIQRVYGELGRPPDAPLATWRDAFKPHNYIGVAEQVGGKWKNWMLDFPVNSRTPGDAGELPTLWEYIQMTLQLLHAHFETVVKSRDHLRDDYPPPAWLASLVHHAIDDVNSVLIAGSLSVGEMLMRGARHVAEALPSDPLLHAAQDHHIVLRFLSEFIDWLRVRVEAYLDTDDALRRLWIYADLAGAMIRGVITSGVMYHEEGLDILDDQDFRAWLKSNGASAMGYNSGLVQGLYDLVFAYHGGDVSRPSFAAGAALRSLLRIDFTYKGSIFWKMQASMGDTIFTPIYEVLARRGVKFQFFHRVKNLGLSPDGSQIATIDIGQQVTLVHEDGTPKDSAEYDPFILVKGLKCWPSQPNYNQIKEGKDLQNGIVNGVQAQDGPINLESYWTPWADAAEKTLRVGEDFDLVVLGIAVGALPYICPELIRADPRWQAMTANVETVRTMAMQLWLKPSLEELGWTLPSPVIDGYAEPQNTWADMSYLTEREDWPADIAPQNVAYYCGPMRDDIPGIEGVGGPAAALAYVKDTNKAWLQQYSGYLWPKATPADNPNGLDWSLLTDPTGQHGEARFASQFSRANIDPSERYVLSVAGSTRYRLRADESGFSNLFLTGDWIQNHFNMGCVEATVMSGMQCSNAISGYPALQNIVGHFHP